MRLVISAFLIAFCLTLAYLWADSQEAEPRPVTQYHCVEGDLCWNPLIMGNHMGTVYPMEVER